MYNINENNLEIAIKVHSKELSTYLKQMTITTTIVLDTVRSLSTLYHILIK